MTLTGKNAAGTMAIIRLTETVLSFFACAFTGWLYEVLLTLAVDGVFVNRGLLRLPICPIYGIFGIFLRPLSGRSAGRIFLWVSAAATVFELAASYVIEAVLGYRLWDYSRWIFNFDGRVSLLSSLVFGGLGVLFLRVIAPAAGRFCERFPRWALMCAAVMSASMIWDMVLLQA